jgi:hypothetical protein
MGTSDSPRWRAERQLLFLDALTRTRNVARAAASAGMSRESAYRLRNRPSAGLFAALWDRIVSRSDQPGEGHSCPLTDGRLARLLGTHFARQSGDFSSIGATEEGWRLG